MKTGMDTGQEEAVVEGAEAGVGVKTYLTTPGFLTRRRPAEYSRPTPVQSRQARPSAPQRIKRSIESYMPVATVYL